MASAKPPKPPTFDAKNFAKRLYEKVCQGGYGTGSPFAVFDYEDDAASPIGFPRWKEWVRALRDTVNANATYLDDVKTHLDGLDDREATHHAAQAARLTALEEAVANPPFPG